MNWGSMRYYYHILWCMRWSYCKNMKTKYRVVIRCMSIVFSKAERLINRKQTYDPISDDLIHLHWLPVQQRIDFKIMVLTYKYLHQQAPEYLSSMLQVQTDRRPLRYSSAPLLFEPRTHHRTFADSAFTCYAPRQWNRLPTHIRNANSLFIFKRLLKCHLFNVAYGL